jgi:uncharacterized protein (TIGR02147 family)
MLIYEFTDYKRFLNAQIAQMPKKGRGQARRLAEHLGVHAVVVSQVLAGQRDFTHEQSLEVALYFGLDARATDYLTTLVLKARAGTKKLEAHLSARLTELREEALKLKNRIPEHRKLSEEDMAIFYSNWFYSGVRLITELKGFSDIDSIATYFGLGRAKVGAIMQYLVSRGLCREDARGRFSIGATSTFIDADSPFVNNLHRNWRLKALERLPARKENDFLYSAPCTISKKDKDAFREELTRFVASFVKRAQGSETEQLTCLNIDWFDF